MLIKTENINFDFLWDNDTCRKSGESNNFYIYSDGTSPYYYQSSKSHFQKNLYRYQEILKCSFFGEKPDKTFKDFWNYKLGPGMEGYKEQYNKNMERFANEKHTAKINI